MLIFLPFMMSGFFLKPYFLENNKIEEVFVKESKLLVEGILDQDKSEETILLALDGYNDKIDDSIMALYSLNLDLGSSSYDNPPDCQIYSVINRVIAVFNYNLIYLSIMCLMILLISYFTFDYIKKSKVKVWVFLFFILFSSIFSTLFIGFSFGDIPSNRNRYKKCADYLVTNLIEIVRDNKTQNYKKIFDSFLLGKSTFNQFLIQIDSKIECTDINNNDILKIPQLPDLN